MKNAVPFQARKSCVNGKLILRWRRVRICVFLRYQRKHPVHFIDYFSDVKLLTPKHHLCSLGVIRSEHVVIVQTTNSRSGHQVEVNINAALRFIPPAIDPLIEMLKIVPHVS